MSESEEVDYLGDQIKMCHSQPVSQSALLFQNNLLLPNLVTIDPFVCLSELRAVGLAGSLLWSSLEHFLSHSLHSNAGRGAYLSSSLSGPD